jgi:muramoyltetrapeptide carboxypeptidase
MRILKPRALRRNDVIGICAPASPPDAASKIERGIAYIERLGYRIEVGRNVFRRRGYLAGSDAQRAADLNELFANRHVKAIFTVRGGYGSHRILPYLDYPAIRRNPKLLVGYSDITALQLAIFANCGLVSLSGPMVASNMAGGLRGKAEEYFWQCLSSARPLPSIQLRTYGDKGSARHSAQTGRLLGGNLSIVHSLLGTRYLPTRDPIILLLEEIEERPYRIDRMLNHLNLTGLLARSRGVVLGRFTDCRPEKGKPSLTLTQVFEDAFQDFTGPILSGLHYGHVGGSLAMPLGVRAAVDGQRGTLRFLEPLVLL